MILPVKYCGLLLIALYLIATTGKLAHANNVSQVYGTSVQECTCYHETAAYPDQDIPNGEGHEADDDESDCSFSCHMPVTLFFLHYAPYTTCFEVPEALQRLPQVYTSIFVPPQNFS